MTQSTVSNSYRWLQLTAGILCMVMIANLQYGWTLFVTPIDDKFHWGRPGIQVAFSIFVLCETWLVPVEGWFVDRFGPKIVVFVGGILVAIAWVMNGYAQSLTVLYIAAAIGGIGAGGVYGTCVGNALKWFPDHRGLAAGLTAAGFGAGSALTIIPIQNMIQSGGYEINVYLLRNRPRHRDRSGLLVPCRAESGTGACRIDEGEAIVARLHAG